MALLKGWNREIFRLKSRRIAYKVLKYIFDHLLFILYILAVCSLLILPHPIAHENADPDEKALLIGQVSRYFSREDLNSNTMLPAHFGQDSPLNYSLLATYLESQFDLIGFDTSLQSFNYSRDAQMIGGMNIHGIFRSPRAEGTESILLAAPMLCADGMFNENGIRSLLAFASFCKKFSFWSKDIIFLITSQGYVGTMAWLEAYHGYDSKRSGIVFSPLKNHAGSIISMVNMEFGGSGQYSSVSFHPIGVNGRLANADLTTTVVRSFQYSGISMLLHQDGKAVNDNYPWFDNYVINLYNLLSFIKTQALGVPVFNHALFALYNIEAVSVTGVIEEGKNLDVDISKIGLALETACRSLNNLLERFHHAYWFYLMPAADKFVPLSKYIGQLIAVISATILASIGIWWNAGEPTSTPSKSSKVSSWRFMKREIGVSSFSVIVRPLYMPLLSLVLSASLPIWVFTNMQTISFLANEDSLSTLFIFSAVMVAQATLVWFLIPLLQRLACGDAGASKLVVAPAWKILHSFTSGLLGILLVMLATTNPSLALLLALPNIPVFLFLRPSSSFIIIAFQSFILTCLSPPSVIGFYSILSNDIMVGAKFVSEAFHFWQLYGGLLLPILFCYWTLNISAQVIVIMCR